MSFLSVIIPAYNREKTIEQTLLSIRASLYKDYELLVIDDGSDDRTGEIAEKYADRVFRHEKNLGEAAARNSGLQISQGDIIINIDSDIVIQPESLNLIVDYLIIIGIW